MYEITIRRFFVFTLLCLLFGCDSSGTQVATPEQSNSDAASKGDPALPDNGHDRRVSEANSKVAQAVALAEVHFKHEEFDEAERALKSALLDSMATDKSKAIALLDKIKTARRESQKNQKTVAHKKSSNSKTTTSRPQTAAASNDPSSIPPVPATKAPMPAAKAVAGSLRPKAGVPSASAEPSEAETATSKTTGVDEPAESKLPPKPSTQSTAKPAPKKSSPVEKTLATSAEIGELENAAKRLRTAAEALELYDRFLATHTFQAWDRDAFNPKHERWKSEAKRGVMRYGKRWLSPEEIAAIQKEADTLISDAFEKIVANDPKSARIALQKASRIDEEGVRADFVLGILNSIDPFYHPPTAEKHFQEVVRRSPKHVSALNNLAIAEVKQGKYTEAIGHWKQLLTIAPTMPEATQNLGRLLSEGRKKRVQLRAGIVKSGTDLLKSIPANSTEELHNPSVGWLYTPLLASTTERDRDRKESKSTRNARTIGVASGTGFVIHPEYVLTCRHLLQNSTFGAADVVRILDPADPKRRREIDAEVVALSDVSDLAIIRCPGLQLPAIPISDQVPPRAAEIMVVGFPEAGALGKTVKSTRGTIAGLPDEETQNLLLYDATTNPGNSGGPVCNSRAEVIAVHTIGYQLSGKLGSGVPCDQIREFLLDKLPIVIPAITSSEMKWPEVDKTVSRSTVMINIYQHELPLDLGTATRRSTKHFLEDRRCSSCNGSGSIPCESCHGGSISVKEPDVLVQRFGDQEFRTNTTRTVRRRCPKCSGKGQLSCGHCKNGTDPDL